MTGVEALDDGHHAAWAEFDVDAAAWAEWKANLGEDEPGGMSFSMTAALPGDSYPADPADVTVAADAAHFSPEELRSAALALQPMGSTEARYLFQFSSVSDALVIFNLLVTGGAALAPNVIASALWDAAKALWRDGTGGRQRTKFQLNVRRRIDGSERLRLVIDVPDVESLRAALAQTPDVIESTNFRHAGLRR